MNHDIDPTKPLPAKGDVYEEFGVRHQPRRFVVVTGKVEEYENTVPRIGLKRIKPNGQLANTTGMWGVRTLQDERGMRLVERAASGRMAASDA